MPNQPPIIGKTYPKSSFGDLVDKNRASHPLRRLAVPFYPQSFGQQAQAQNTFQVLDDLKHKPGLGDWIKLGQIKNKAERERQRKVLNARAKRFYKAQQFLTKHGVK